MEPEGTLAMDPGDLEADNVYDIADMLLRGNDEEEQSGHIIPEEDDGNNGHVTAGDAGAENGWVNPLASIQAYTVEPQVLLQEMLENGAQGFEYYESEKSMPGDSRSGEEICVRKPNIIQIDPTILHEKMTEGEMTGGKTEVKEADFGSILAKTCVSDSKTATASQTKENHLGNIKSEPADDEEFDNGYEPSKDTSDVGEMEKEEQDTEEEYVQPQYNIVSLDPTAFPDAKVSKMLPLRRSQDRQVGRRSKHKHIYKPRKLKESPEPVCSEEPVVKKPKRDELKITISLKDIKTEAPAAAPAPVVQKRGRGRPRKQPIGEPANEPRGTGRPRGRPKGRPPKSGRLPLSRSSTVEVKQEPIDEGYEDETCNQDADYCPFEGRPRRSRRTNVKSVKGTHIMQFKEYRCFECNDDRMYTDKEAFIEHWRGSHFEVEEDGANLYCPDCGQKFTVYLQRFHRAADVLQYVAFYFNHKIKRHGLQPPPYIEEMRCPKHNCHFKTYTSYALSRHMLEGRHRMRGPRLFQMPLDPGLSLSSQGNKYALNFKEFRCFVCNDNVVFSELIEMLNHWRDNHFQFTEEEAVIPCGFCDAQYKVPRGRFHRQTDTMQYIAYFFSHLVKKHSIEVPVYIEQLKCSQPGCKFVTYTKQLLLRHLQEVKHVTLSRTPALDNHEGQGSVGVRSPYLSFTEYRCFLCVSAQGEHEGPFENGAVLAEHWRESHFTEENDKAVLRCRDCPMHYQVQLNRFSRNADVLAMIARYFTHVVKKHYLEPPYYIEQLHCSVPGCEYKCFTPQIMDGHRMTKRDPAHMGVIVDNSEKMPKLSLRHLNRGQNQHLQRSNSEMSESQDSTTSLAKKDVSTANTSSDWNTDILSLSKEIADNVLKNLPEEASTSGNVKGDEAGDLGTSTENSFQNHSAASLEESIDTSDMKAKSLLCFIEIKCFECNDGKVYASHNEYVNHWRTQHFKIGTYEVYISCSLCSARIGLNKPLWHRDHDIGRCVASYLTHSMKKHSTACPEFIKELECPEVGCGYKTLTVKHMQFHVRHTKHHKLERAKRAAVGLNPHINIQDLAKRSLSFRINDNGLTFKEYQCYLCGDGVFYKNCVEYETHWRQKHVTIQDDNKECLTCHVCNATFISHLYPSIAFLFCHLVKKHEFQVPWYIEEYSCEEEHCNYVTYTKALLAKHKLGQRHSSGSGIFQYYLNFKEYRCLLCPVPNIVYPSKKVFENHLMSDHVERCGDSSDYLRCPECNHHFTLHHCKKPEINYDKPDPSRTLCVLYNHIIVKHKWEIPSYLVTFECPHEDCNFVTVRKYTLDRHVASHTADQQCYQCGMFFSKTRIDKHFKKCLSGKPSEASIQSSRSYPCPDCGVSLVQKKALRRHLQEAHGKSGSDLPESKYKKVKASETGIAYKCDDCGKVLLEKKSMKRHIQSVHMKIVESNQLQKVQYQAKGDDGPKHYECMLCGVQMNLMKSVKRHMMKQHGIKVGGAQDLESCYVRMDPQAPLKPFIPEPVKRKLKDPKNPEEFHMGAQDLSTIDDSEISDFVTQPRPFIAVSPEPNKILGHDQALIEMTTVPHFHRSELIDTLKLPAQKSIFPTVKHIPSTSVVSSANQALDFSMRLGELEAGEIPSSSPLLSNPRMVAITTSSLSQAQSLADLQNNPSSILSIAARHIHNGQPPPVTAASPPPSHRIELLTQRFVTPQAPSMGIMPGTVDPRDINVHIPIEPTGTLFGQRLHPWNLPNQS